MIVCTQTKYIQVIFMRKKFCVLIFVICLFLQSCGSNATADEIAFKLLNLYPTVPPCSQYVKYSGEHEAGYITPEDFSYFYTGKHQELPEWDLIDQFRVIMSDSTYFFEIHVIKVKSSADTEEIAKLLERRVRLIDLYNKEESDYPAEKPLLYTKGKYVILIATDDNEAASRLLDKIL